MSNSKDAIWLHPKVLGELQGIADNREMVEVPMTQLAKIVDQALSQASINAEQAGQLEHIKALIAMDPDADDFDGYYEDVEGLHWSIVCHLEDLSLITRET